MLARKK
jgi:hypothetical protein